MAIVCLQDNKILEELKKTLSKEATTAARLHQHPESGTSAPDCIHDIITYAAACSVIYHGRFVGLMYLHLSETHG